MQDIHGVTPLSVLVDFEPGAPFDSLIVPPRTFQCRVTAGFLREVIDLFQTAV